MVDEALNIDLSAQNDSDSESCSRVKIVIVEWVRFYADTSFGEQTDDPILSSASQLADEEKIELNTGVAVSELPCDVKESFNVAAKQLSLLCDSVDNTSPITRSLEEFDDHDAESDERVASPTVAPSSKECSGTTRDTVIAFRQM